ncbi:hypothetical protein KKF82_06465 [Patescibacteria group bacterium]|nr:hypothetical protein [Patescibacteria group bacterium]
MEIAINEFKSVLKRATLNFSIESVQLKLSKDRIKSSMISEHRNAMSFVDIKNEVCNVDKEYEFNFNQPNSQLIPFLNFGETANIKIHDEKVVISSGRQRSNIHFCSPEIVSTFELNSNKDIDYFITVDVDDDFIEAFSKIRKLGSLFDNIYFNVEKGKFNIEISDRYNPFSNGLKFDLVDIKGVKDLSLMFDYKNFVNLMNVIGDRNESFKLNFTYIENKDMGMLAAEINEDNNIEKYYLMSRNMENNI